MHNCMETFYKGKWDRYTPAELAIATRQELNEK